MSKNAELAKLFETAAKILDLKNDNPFKAIAFNKVARLLKDGDVDAEKAYADGKLEKTKGIGGSSADMIREYLDTGKSTDFEELKASIPEGLIPMFDLPGMGPKTIKLLWDERNITSIGKLSTAIERGKLKGVKGIGPKKIEGFKDAIAMAKRGGERRGIWKVLAVADELLEAGRGLEGVLEAEAAGSLRRRRETVKDVDLIARVADDADGSAITAAFAKLDVVKKVLVQGPTKCSVLVGDDLQVDLRIIPEKHYGAALIHFTGSKEHNVALRGIANDKGLTLNDWGLYETKKWEKADRKPGLPPADVEPVASANEGDVYAALDMTWIAPELREDRGEVQKAQADELPDLLELKDLRGDLHTHTVASDGRATIEEMAEAAKALGHKYLAITDHSKSSVIANGLDADRLLHHIDTIHEINKKIDGIEMLAGSEVDILADGTLDYPDDVLEKLDWVVASPHTALKQDRAKATARIIAAIENPNVCVIGHPTGRYINKREGLPLDLDAVFEACKATGCALEINASYPRLDLGDVPARKAAAAGVMLVINTDAHGTDGLSGLQPGIDVARRAGLEKKHVLNTRTWKQLKVWLDKKRGR
ncbi:MAG: DNA polymerase/3'-5' exonuclease PolX [Planctomycetota bacterium]